MDYAALTELQLYGCTLVQHPETNKKTTIKSNSCYTEGLTKVLFPNVHQHRSAVQATHTPADHKKNVLVIFIFF